MGTDALTLMGAGAPGIGDLRGDTSAAIRSARFNRPCSWAWSSPSACSPDTWSAS